MSKQLGRLTCPVCAQRKRNHKLKMQAYGARRVRVWCGQCDRFFGPVSYFSKKSARQSARKVERD